MDTKGRNRAALPSSEAPVIKCVSCGEEMFAHWQPHPLGGGYWEVTCKTSALECPMSWYTLTADQYPPENLEEYVLSGLERARKVVERQKAHRKVFLEPGTRR